MMIDLGADARRVVDEVKSKMNSITTLPIETLGGHPKAAICGRLKTGH